MPITSGSYVHSEIHLLGHYPHSSESYLNGHSPRQLGWKDMSESRLFDWSCVHTHSRRGDIGSSVTDEPTSECWRAIRALSAASRGVREVSVSKKMRLRSPGSAWTRKRGRCFFGETTWATVSCSPREQNDAIRLSFQLLGVELASTSRLRERFEAHRYSPA